MKVDATPMRIDATNCVEKYATKKQIMTKRILRHDLGTLGILFMLFKLDF